MVNFAVVAGMMVLSALDISSADGSCSVQSDDDGTTIQFSRNLWRELSQGLVGLPGEQGPPGPPGDKGPPGRRGRPGVRLDPTVEMQFEERIARLERWMAERSDLSPTTASTTTTAFAAPLTSEPYSGWYSASNGFAYKLFRDREKYDEARKACTRFGTRLASTGLRDFSVKHEIYTALGIDGYTWVGLDDLERKFNWMWADHVEGTSDNIDWADGEPNNDNAGDERCVHFFGSVKFNDRRCSDGLMYLCEMPIRSW